MDQKEQIKVLLISEDGRMCLKGNDLSLCGRTEKNLKDFCSDRIGLAIAYVAGNEDEEKRVDDGTVFYPLHVSMSVGTSTDEWNLGGCRKALLEVIDDYRPDIIQCFGSEWPYGQIAEDTEVPVIIHMMGFLNEYYPAIDMAIGFEEWRLNPPQNEDPEPEPDPAGKAIRKILRKIVKRTPEETETHTFIVRPETVNSETERRTMKANKYFLGRTDWDRNIVRHYSPGAKYFHVAEFMKEQVYDAAGSWRYSLDGKLRLLSVLSSDERKGNEIILRAAKVLKELNGPDFEWRVTCVPDALKRFELKTGIMHEYVNVKPIGFIETPQIIEEMQQADLFIHPSIIDNSPNAVCEAQLIGCPVIASNVGGVPQLVKHGETGLLYPYNEAHTLAFKILDLYENREDLETLSANAATEALKRHDPEKTANTLVSVYEKILAETELANEELRGERAIILKELEKNRNSFNEIEQAFFWKATKPVRMVADQIKKPKNVGALIHIPGKVVDSIKSQGVKVTLRKIQTRLASTPSYNKSYNKWMKKHKVSDEELERQRNTDFEKDITFSVTVPLYNTPEEFLKEMIDSVINQTYRNWELCLADGSDDDHQQVEIVCREYAKNDDRIKYHKLDENLGISGNTNACLEMSTGEYIALFDHDDILHPSALFEMMRVICEKDPDIIYTDEATFLSPDINKITVIHFKPDFAPDNLKANNYICHFTAFKRSLLEKTGLFRSEYDGSQDHDMILRLTEQAEIIEHIPKVLYYWRAHPGSVALTSSAKNYTSGAGIKAVKDSIEREGLKGTVAASRVSASVYRVKYDITGSPKISIIIPTCDHVDLLDKCIKSIEEKSTYNNYEIVLIENNSKDDDTFRYYEKIENKYSNIKIVTWDKPFNYSAINNYGIKQAAIGDYILLLNNDIEVITPDWMQEMLMYAQRHDVGAVGAKLLYPDNTIQHAGVLLGKGGIASHLFAGVPGDAVGYMARLCYAQNLSAVTAACMMIRHDVWDEMSGFDEGYPVAFNDVDLCMRIRKAGYLIAWTPHAELYHYESKSRGRDDDTPEKRERFLLEQARFKSKWSAELAKGDPYYNPNFTTNARRRDFTLEQ